MTKNYALFSGGTDSLVATHYAMENGHAEEVIYLDTNTGIPENLEYVEGVCESFGWPLRVEEAPLTLKEFVDRFEGFPGPQAHRWAYIFLKERQLERVATETEGKPHFWTGVRKDESTRRRMNVPDELTEEVDQWIWENPIAYWSDERVEAYIEYHGLPTNPVHQLIHRSGDCYCGAFASRDEELIDLQANFPEHYEWLMEVEEYAIEQLGEDCERAYWGHGSASERDLQALADEYEPREQVLCQDCRREAHNSAGDADWSDDE